MIKDHLDELRQRVGDQDLLCQPDDEDTGTRRSSGQSMAPRLQLACHCFVADNRSSHELREQ